MLDKIFQCKAGIADEDVTDQTKIDMDPPENAAQRQIASQGKASYNQYEKNAAPLPFPSKALQELFNKSDAITNKAYGMESVTGIS
jgi:hypothetical protein